MVDAAAVAALLAKSQAAHWRYHQNIPHTTAMPGGPLATSGGNDALAQAALAEAATLRQQAHDLDPDHTAGAWRDEASRFPHAELTQFYAQQLASRNGH